MRWWALYTDILLFTLHSLFIRKAFCDPPQCNETRGEEQKRLKGEKERKKEKDAPREKEEQREKEEKEWKGDRHSWALLCSKAPEILRDPLNHPKQCGAGFHLCLSNKRQREGLWAARGGLEPERYPSRRVKGAEREKHPHLLHITDAPSFQTGTSHFGALPPSFGKKHAVEMN